MFKKISKYCYSIEKKVKRIVIKVLDNTFYIFWNKIKKVFLKKIKSNTYFSENLNTYVSKIPNSSGSNYYNKIKLKIGIITDEYMYNYYKDAVDLIYIDYVNYKSIVKKVDIVLFVSCWKGLKNNDWRGMSTEIGRNKVIEVFEYAKKLNKKTIFQTIEDPSNFDLFLPIAKHANYIFTTDLDMIDKYKKKAKNNNVFLLDYGVNPCFHNPVGCKEVQRKIRDTVFFAGSWAPRYVERCNDAKMLFDGTIMSGKNLILADRNYYIRGYNFPTKYYKYTIPAIKHENLQNAHKLFDWALNLNSIKYSPTMCAMRIYELQAIGNLMISNYSIAVSNQFPNIFITETSEEVSRILNSYDDIHVYEMQIDGIRNVMSHHTVFDKLNYIFRCIGEKKYIILPKNVLVICERKSEKIKKMFEIQTYENKKLVTVDELKNINLEEYNYITFFGENIQYKKYYLEDMINAFKYTNSDFVTIMSKIVNNKITGVNHNYVKKAENINLVVFDGIKYNINNILKNKRITGNGYSIDPFQITNIKHKSNKEKKLSVIVPIYNNGKFLKYRCFNSLIRSSIFDELEIILVDDGSTDKETLDIINELENKHSNVKKYCFSDKGSGSASRPRNKGIELATCEFVTFLDPDNEAINDGYAKLLDIVYKGNYDFAYGHIIKLSDKKTVLRYFSNDKKIENPRQTLIDTNFKTNSIQACVISKKLITDNNIINPIGAAGQDSFFFHELMINSKKAYYLNQPIHIYYAARDGSIVNNIGKRFFEKFLIMEKYQVKKLNEYNLLEEYKKRRFEMFYKNWYLEKLKLVKNDKEKKEAKEIIRKIKNLYN